MLYKGLNPEAFNGALGGKAAQHTTHLTHHTLGTLDTLGTEA